MEDDLIKKRLNCEISLILCHLQIFSCILWGLYFSPVMGTVPSDFQTVLPPGCGRPAVLPQARSTVFTSPLQVPVPHTAWQAASQ